MRSRIRRYWKYNSRENTISFCWVETYKGCAISCHHIMTWHPKVYKNISEPMMALLTDTYMRDIMWRLMYVLWTGIMSKKDRDVSGVLCSGNFDTYTNSVILSQAYVIPKDVYIKSSWRCRSVLNTVMESVLGDFDLDIKAARVSRIHCVLRECILMSTSEPELLTVICDNFRITLQSTDTGI